METVTETGTDTPTLAGQLPQVHEPRNAGMPLLLRRICRPDWLPAGTLTRPRPPSIVGTSMSPPKAAEAIDTGTRQ